MEGENANEAFLLKVVSSKIINLLRVTFMCKRKHKIRSLFCVNAVELGVVEIRFVKEI